MDLEKTRQIVKEYERERERLVKIGQATEKAFNYGFIVVNVVENSSHDILAYHSISEVDDLIEWAEED